MTNTSLSPKGLGISLALISGICMLLLSLLGLAGYMQEAVNMMQVWHLGYQLTFIGILIGIVEAAVLSYVAGWLTALLHNKFA